MEPEGSCPRIFKRECGGWLTVSDAKDPLQIGVTAASENEARKIFQETRDRWKAILGSDAAVDGRARRSDLRRVSS
jgi:hypothetical protein